MSFRHENERLKMRVRLGWGSYNTGLLTNKLYRHVETGDFDHSIEARPGSLITEITIGVSVTLSVELVKEIGKYIAKRHDNEKKRKQEHYDPNVPPTEITINGDHNEINITVESERDVYELLDELESMEDEDDN